MIILILYVVVDFVHEVLLNQWIEVVVVQSSMEVVVQ